MRNAASCGHPLQEMAEPRGDLTTRVPIVMTKGVVRNETGAWERSEGKKGARACQSLLEK
jgi:hypothetical protein